jgi:alkylhydroperoxidase family enzyme
MFKQFDENSAPEDAKHYLQHTKKSFGMIPNLERTMAGLPALLSVYSFAWDAFPNTPLNTIEQQVVYQVANYENECNYCVPWHTLLSKQAGMPDDISDALREGATLKDEKLQALAVFTRQMLNSRGHVSQRQLDEFLAVGYDETHVLAVVLGIAIKTMSNFTNAVAQTPLDKEVNPYRWHKPMRRMQE